MTREMRGGGGLFNLIREITGVGILFSLGK